MAPDIAQTTADENEATLCKAMEHQYRPQILHMHIYRS